MIDLVYLLLRCYISCAFWQPAPQHGCRRIPRAVDCGYTALRRGVDQPSTVFKLLTEEPQPTHSHTSHRVDPESSPYEVFDIKSRSHSPSLLPLQASRWQTRTIALPFYKATLTTPNTAIYRNRLPSRLLHKFPFLVEAWYWALIYWVHQLGRAFSALTLVEGIIAVARRHALQLVELEQNLGIFWEVEIQRRFISYPTLMRGTN